jgi:Spy/CpxP family protein refolding chaperone
VREIASQPCARNARRLRGWARALDLSDEQRQRVREIADRHRPARRTAMAEVMERCGEPLRASKAALDVEIRAVLAPAQQERFDVLVRRQEERFFRGGGE